MNQENKAINQMGKVNKVNILINQEEMIIKLTKQVVKKNNKVNQVKNKSNQLKLEQTLYFCLKIYYFKHIIMFDNIK